MVQQRKEEEMNGEDKNEELESCSGEEEEVEVEEGKVSPVQIDLASLSHESSERFEQVNVDGDEREASAVPEEGEEEEEGRVYNAKLAEKILSQAIQLEHQEEEIERMKRKLRKDSSASSTAPRISKDKKIAQQTIAKLTERVLKAEKREAESKKRVNSATQAMKSRDRELKTLRMRSERFDKENKKIDKSNQLMRTYIGKLECRLASAVNTKSDVQKLQQMGQKLSLVKKENESLQSKLSDIMEENILLCESLKEVRGMIDKQALSLGLESGEVLVELTQQKQLCNLLEQKVEATEKDNQLLIDYVKDLRVTASDCQDANLVLDKLSNPNIFKIEKAQNQQQEDKDTILENRLDSVKEEIARLGETVRAQEERERTLIKASNEERSQLKSLTKELGESQAQSDALSLENQSLRKKYQHLKSVFKSLSGFCAEASQIKDLQDIGEVELEKLDEIERQIINLSTNIIGPENRSFIKLYMSVIGNCLEQRRGNINLREESEILRETVKELSTKIAKIGSEKAAMEKELSKQQVVSEIHSHTKSLVGENSMIHDSYSTPPVESPPFRFQTKSYADSFQAGSSSNKDPESVRSDETSRKIDELERELHLVKTIAKRSRDLQGQKSDNNNTNSNGEEEEEEGNPTPAEKAKAIGFGSVSKLDSESSGLTDYMSPMSNSGFDSPSPIVDWGRYSKFTPGKYSMKERMQLLQNRFVTLGAEVEKAEVNE